MKCITPGSWSGKKKVEEKKTEDEKREGVTRGGGKS